MNKVKKTDLLFVVFLMLGLIVHLTSLIYPSSFQDESVYVAIPLRLLNGDSLIQEEWHLTQFSSLFSYLPVCLWTLIKGSTEYLFLFLRCVYLILHTAISVLIYGFFRKYGKWAILASLIFFIQSPYYILNISYQSVYVIALLLLSLCLISIYKKQSIVFYILAGICFGCCCVCNPFFCVVFVLYLLVCALWTRRQDIVSSIAKFKTSKTDNQKGKKLTKKQKREKNQQISNAFPNMENYTCFFTKEAILWITCGISIIAVVAVGFFFMTCGTLSSIFDNMENLLGSSEYDIASDSIFAKPITTIGFFIEKNFYLPFVLPVLFIALFADKKRKNNSHRIIYLTFTILWSLLFAFDIYRVSEVYVFAVSLPFYAFSLVCYLLTENRNKTIFYCMFIPCTLGAFIQYLAADTHLGAIGIVLSICNVAGVFFSMDLWKEMRHDSNNEDETTPAKSKTNKLRLIIIMGFCLQVLIYSVFRMLWYPIVTSPVNATEGVYAGLYMSESEYEKYSKLMDDMNYIKEISRESDPVLIASYNNWMYIQVDRPMATYSTWYRGTLYTDQLIKYYKENPEKIPRYVYMESSDPQNAYTGVVDELFQYTRQDLSNGVLLTVEDCKF